MIGELAKEYPVLFLKNVRVATFGNRHDFELVMRGLMAAKDGPEKKIPATQGAAMLTVI